MIVNDAEADKMFAYFLFAYYFHWSKAEVDNTDAYLVECMLSLLPLWMQKVNSFGDKHG
jgi:hypothetical protein